MIVALGAAAIALLFLGWCVLRLTSAIERQADAVEAHGVNLVQFGRSVYGTSALSRGEPADSNLTVADAEAAELLAQSDDARPSKRPT